MFLILFFGRAGLRFLRLWGLGEATRNYIGVGSEAMELDHSRQRYWVWILGGVLLLLSVAGLLLRTLYFEFFVNEPMVGAVISRDVDDVRRYLEMGADPGARWEDGRSAVEIARENGDQEIVELLERYKSK